MPKKGNPRTRKALIRNVRCMVQFRLLRVLGAFIVGNAVFHRTVADSVEAVFILVAFRRFAQFSDNQRERTTHSRNDKACSYDPH